MSELAITDTLKAEPWYAQYFFGKEHSNYIGNDDLLGVLIISVIQEAHTVGHPMLSLSDGDVPIENGNKESVKVRAIVRTKKVIFLLLNSINAEYRETKRGAQ